MSEPTLRSIAGDLAAIVEKIGPSVVRVAGRRRGASSGAAWSADTVITASHAIEWDEEIAVAGEAGEPLRARLVGRDPSTDVALLKVEGANLPRPNWRDDGAPRVGELVLGLLRPGRSIRASLGVIAARADAWRGPAGGRFDRYLETDLALRRGFSGGILADAVGGVIGMNTSGILRGVPFTVSTSTVRRVATALLAHGHVRRGYLGIGAAPVVLPSELAEKTKQRSALLILSVAPDSPAARAGLYLGDVLVSLGGSAVENPQDLVPLLEEERIGKETTARILRGGELRELKLTIGTKA